MKRQKMVESIAHQCKLTQKIVLRWENNNNNVSPEQQCAGVYPTANAFPCPMSTYRDDVAFVSEPNENFVCSTLRCQFKQIREREQRREKKSLFSYWFRAKRFTTTKADIDTNETEQNRTAHSRSMRQFSPSDFVSMATTSTLLLALILSFNKRDECRFFSSVACFFALYLPH